MSWGGKRQGAGRREGSKNVAVLARAVARAQLQTRLLAELAPITERYIARAKGVFVLMIPTELGRVRVTNEADIVKVLSDPTLTNGVDYFYVESAAPDAKVLLDLVARIDGKPTERVEVSGPAGEPLEVHHHYATPAPTTASHAAKPAAKRLRR